VNKNIQFARIDVKKQSRAKQTALVFLGAVLLAVLSFFTVLSVRAYFTSTAEKSGELNFGTIEVKLLDGTSDFTASSFQTKYLTGIMPGSTLNFNSINVKNTGTHNAYVLLNLDVSIPSKDGNASKLLHYNKWFNANGEEVNTTNMAINQTKPTLIASGASVTSNIQWKVPSIVGNDYKTSTVTVNMTVYGSQTNLKDAAAYADHQLYASYFICSNASKIANDNGTTYSGATITQDPLRRIVTSKNLWNSAGVSYPRTVSGITLDYDPSTQIYTFNGTSTGSGDLYIRPNGSGILSVNGGDAYTISAYIVGGTIGGSYWLSAYINNASWSAGLSTMINSTQVTTGTKTFSSTESITKMYFYVGGAGVVCNNLQVKVQLEKGATATTYEAYSGVEDTFDINTQTLTRNVNKIELTGNEAWNTSYAPTIYFNLVGVGFGAGLSQNVAVVICSHTPSTNSGESFHARITNSGGTCIGFAKCFEGFGVDNLGEFTAYLAEQYANGTPVTFWYQLATPTTEKVVNQTIRSSKNLVNLSGYEYSDEVVTITNDKIIIKKTANLYSYTCAENLKLKPNTRYIISCNVKGEFTGRVYAFFGTSLYSNSILNGYFKSTFTTDANGVTLNNTDKVKFRIHQNSSNTSVNVNMISDTVELYNIQLEEGSTATAYEPYTETTGKNLLDASKFNGGSLIDGGFVVSGTKAWNQGHIVIENLTVGEYCLSANFEQLGTLTSVLISPRKLTDNSVHIGAAKSDLQSGRITFSFTIPEGETGTKIYFYSNNSSNAIETSTRYTNVQLEVGSTATAYEPYGMGSTVVIDDIDVINAIKDKEFVASSLIRKFEDDTSTIEENQLGYMITIEYVYAGGSIKTSSKINCEYDSYFGSAFNWVSNKEILNSISQTNLNTVKRINIYLNDCYEFNNYNFKLQDFKIELGEAPTSV